MTRWVAMASLVVGLGCAPAGEAPSTSAAASAGMAGASGSGSPSAPPRASAAPPGPLATPEAIAAAKAGIVESDAALLRKLGGTYLCDQRIYPHPPAAHISAWEWAFPEEPEALAAKLAAELAGAEREASTFRYAEGGRVQISVTVHAESPSKLGCTAIPPGTKSLVVASRM